MRWTRLSFVYLMSYLLAGGAGLLAAPDLALQLLFASGEYPPGMARFMGALMVAIGLIVVQIFRHRVEVMYPTALMVRVVLLGTALGVYAQSRDPLFLSISAIIALGMLFTGAGLLADRRR